MCECHAGDGLQEGAICDCILQNMRKSVDIGARKDELCCNGSDKVMRSADTIAHYDGTPTAHSFVDYYCERLVLGGQYHEISRGVDGWELGLVDEAKKADARSNAKSCGFRFKLGSKRTFASEKQERIRDVCFCEGA